MASALDVVCPEGKAKGKDMQCGIT